MYTKAMTITNKDSSFERRILDIQIHGNIGSFDLTENRNYNPPISHSLLHIILFL
jgi:hypothetical protein